MTQPLFDPVKLRMYGPGDVESVVVNYDQVTQGNAKFPALKFSGGSRILSATLFVNNESSSGTNLLQVGLRNGGVTGAGTIITAAQSSGTVLAGSAYALTIATGGPDIYAAGELCMLDVTSTMTTTDFSVQIDFLPDAN